MSWTATVLVLCGLEENYPNGNDDGADENFVEIPPPIEAIDSWLSEHEQHPLQEFGDCIEGYKSPGANLYGTVLNYGKINELLAFIKTQKWIAPQNVQVLTKDQEEERFTLHTIS